MGFRGESHDELEGHEVIFHTDKERCIKRCGVLFIGMKRIGRNAFAQNNGKRNGGIRMSMNSGKRNLASGAAEVEQ